MRYQMVEQAKVIAELYKLGLYDERQAHIALDSIGWIPPEDNESHEVPEAHGGVGFQLYTDDNEEE